MERLFYTHTLCVYRQKVTESDEKRQKTAKAAKSDTFDIGTVFWQDC